MSEPFIVFLVDDDVRVLKALSRLLAARGYGIRSFTSAQEFLNQHDAEVPGCAILDVSMPALNGLELQKALSTHRCQRQIIFLTGRGDIPTSVRAIKAGAVDFLTKPVHEKDLLDAIVRAEKEDVQNRQNRFELASIEAKIKTLTPREREVLAHVIAGKPNKQIATELGTVEKTVKVHRGRIMEKLEIRSVAELVRLTERVGIGAAAKPRVGEI